MELSCQLKQAGFIEGCIIMLKSAKDAEDEHGCPIFKKWRIHKVKSNGVVMVKETDLYEDDIELEEIHGSHVLLDYKINKSKVKERMMGWHQGDPCPSTMPWFHLECAEAAALLAMRQHLDKYKHHHACVEIWESPTAVLASGPVEKKKLILPCVTMNVDAKPKTSARASWGIGRVTVGTEEVAVHCYRQFAQPMDKNGVASAKPWVVPFWCVQSSKEKKSVNMEINWANYTVESYLFQIPYLTNCNKLNAKDVLYMASDICTTPPAAGGKRKRT